MNEFLCVYHEANKTKCMLLEEMAACSLKNSLEECIPLLKITSSKEEVDYSVISIQNSSQAVSKHRYMARISVF